MAQALGWGEVAPFYIDLAAPVPDSGTPKPGPLKVRLKDDHMQYAITWFCAGRRGHHRLRPAVARPAAPRRAERAGHEGRLGFAVQRVLPRNCAGWPAAG